MRDHVVDKVTRGEPCRWLVRFPALKAMVCLEVSLAARQETFSRPVRATRAGFRLALISRRPDFTERRKIFEPDHDCQFACPDSRDERLVAQTCRATDFLQREERALKLFALPKPTDRPGLRSAEGRPSFGLAIA